MSDFERLLLCTDMDRTLLPNGAQPESSQARKLFYNFTGLPQVTLVYVTGRHQQLVEQAIDEYKLPLPDFVIADVGSTIYQITEGKWQYQNEWESIINSDWQGKSTNDLHKLLENVQGIKLQEKSKQNTHKLSYYVALNQDYTQLIKIIKTILNKNSIAANVIWSVDDEFNTGLLDILPARAGKRQAIEFLIQRLGFTYDNTIFAGDSGNDLCVMNSQIQSVLVANAATDVVEEAVRQAKVNHHENNLYIAHGGLMDMNGNYSAGILEGVVHYIPQTEQWLREKNE